MIVQSFLGQFSWSPLTLLLKLNFSLKVRRRYWPSLRSPRSTRRNRPKGSSVAAAVAAAESPVPKSHESIVFDLSAEFAHHLRSRYHHRCRRRFPRRFRWSPECDNSTRNRRVHRRRRCNLAAARILKYSSCVVKAPSLCPGKIARTLIFRVLRDSHENSSLFEVIDTHEQNIYIIREVSQRPTRVARKCVEASQSCSNKCE